MQGRGNPGFGPPVTPPIIKSLIIANAAVFFVQHLGDIGQFSFLAGLAAGKFEVVLKHVFHVDKIRLHVIDVRRVAKHREL